jgi:hypothetical protein
VDALPAGFVDGPRSTDTADSRCSDGIAIANRIECRGIAGETFAGVASSASISSVITNMLAQLSDPSFLNTISAGAETLANADFIATLYSLVL